LLHSLEKFLVSGLVGKSGFDQGGEGLKRNVSSSVAATIVLVLIWNN
jgi:hypothetical protein